ncbi:MAG: hypothetical protein ACLQBQ_12910 [Smithella sp.]
MRRSSKPLSKDSNKRAYEIFRLSVDEPEAKAPEPERSEISKYLSKIGRRGGLIGGKARADKLSARKRKEIAKKAAQARWTKKK